MTAYLTIKVLGVISSVIGPMPNWYECTNYLPDFQKRADLSFTKPELIEDMNKRWPNIKREYITHECVEGNKPNLGK